jgi:hypothetical protein
VPAAIVRLPQRPVSGVFERLGGGPVGLVGGDAAGGDGSLRCESPVG